MTTIDTRIDALYRLRRLARTPGERKAIARRLAAVRDENRRQRRVEDLTAALSRAWDPESRSGLLVAIEAARA